MKRVLVTLAVAGGLLWISQTAAYAQAIPAFCNSLQPVERPVCAQRYNERRAVCARQATPQAQQACLQAFNALTARLNACQQQPAAQRDDCVRAGLGMRVNTAACSLLPPNEREACSDRINERRAVCERQPNAQARQNCINSFNQLNTRLNSCRTVQPADRRDDCVRAALGLRPPATPAAGPAICNVLTPTERPLCVQRYNERRAACARQATPQAQQACMNAFNQLNANLNRCAQQPPDQRDDCVRATLGLPRASTAACGLLPPNEREACSDNLNQRLATCARQATPQAQQACRQAFSQLNARLNNCRTVQPADRRDDCVRAALGLRPPAAPVAAACNLLPPNERAACNQRINERRATCDRAPNAQARQSCINSFNQLNTRLNNCRTVQPADRRDDCVRAALGLRPAGPTAELGNVRNQLNTLRNRGRSLCGQLPPAERPACVRSLYPAAPPTN